MDRNSPTSFIPKSAITRAPERIPQVVSLPTVIAVLFFVVSLMLYGGSYAYRRILDNSINSPCSSAGSGTGGCGLKESINRARQDLDQATTVYLKRLNDKLLIGEQLVNNHRSNLPIFRLLEDLTLPSIYYTRMSYAANSLTIEGRASSYEDIAVQTSIFSRDRGRIKSFLFSDLDQDSTNNVVFKLVINIEPGVTSYAEALANTPTPVPVPLNNASTAAPVTGTSSSPTNT
jgi:hypothetical protein